ncbi:hypothetical protein SAY86_004170 [Trapa natans]|uniref:Uncharacterized protein n=1 Tax=Trapa natans TaxID=22666 RepID=A0AAN7N634_TRANT|nr:hypothetical protein SAY86_004170 [Trapa natans]
MMIRFVAAVVLLTAMFGCGASRAPPPVTEASLLKTASSLKKFVDKLPMLPKIYGYKMQNGKRIPGSLTVGMYAKKWKFHRDLPPTTVFAYGTSAATATVPGPTIETIQGVPTTLTWLNFLPESHILPWDPTIPTAIPKQGGVPTVVHLHGGVHPPEYDGSAFAWFTANFREKGSFWTRKTYTYPNVQHAGNLWYHDHALGLTRINLLAGLIGAYVIRDPALDAKLNLPSGLEFDQHLFVFDRSFNKDGSLYMNYTGNNPIIHPQWQPEYFGDAIVVNGKAWPYLNVQRRKYRFRIVNAANARYFRFSLTNGLSFTMVGADTSYLPHPVNTDSILMAPSEIADVIIDFSATNAKESVLENNAPYPYPTGTNVNSLNKVIMKFIIAPGKSNPPDTSSVPPVLMVYPPAIAPKGAVKRYIVMYEYQAAGGPTHLYINGKRLEDPATETPKSGTTEVWEVINLTGDDHPLHLHLASFQAIKVQEIVDLSTFTACMAQKNDSLKCNVNSHVKGKLINIPEYERTWKHTVKITPGYQTTIVVKFNLVDNDAPYPFDASTEPGYVYHCHILDHEDNAMIRPLKLLPA